MSTDGDFKGEKIGVEVAYATPTRQVLLKLEVPRGCTIEEAIGRSGIREEVPGLKVDPAAVGIFGRKSTLAQVLQDGDRVEIYRPLKADPKEARRQRALAKKA
jgi:putative ubiquitin-RnfH superfamily antitoxin RatB of RatAB toxin-antitoxin module